MNIKPEFTDRNRFLASIGLILIVLSVLLPWLVIREPFEIHTTTQELTTLTKIAQTTITIRQWMALILLPLSCLMSPLLAAGGILFLGAGLFGWSQREGAEEKRDRAEINKAIKLISQADREAQAFIQNELQIKLKEKFYECIPNAQEVVGQDVMLANYQFEFVLRAFSEDQPDVLIRVGYAKGNKFLELASLYYKIAIKGLSNYRQKVKGNSRFVGLLIAPDANSISPNNFIAKMMRNYHPKDVLFHHLSEQSLSDKSSDDFLKLFFPDGNYPWMTTKTYKPT